MPWERPIADHHLRPTVRPRVRIWTSALKELRRSVIIDTRCRVLQWVHQSLVSSLSFSLSSFSHSIPPSSSTSLSLCQHHTFLLPSSCPQRDLTLSTTYPSNSTIPRCTPSPTDHRELPNPCDLTEFDSETDTDHDRMMGTYTAFPISPPPHPGLAMSPPFAHSPRFMPHPFGQPAFLATSPPQPFFLPPPPITMVPNSKPFGPGPFRPPHQAPAYMRPPLQTNHQRPFFNPVSPFIPHQLGFGAVDPEGYQAFRPPPSRPLYQHRRRDRPRRRWPAATAPLSPKAEAFVPRHLEGPAEISRMQRHEARLRPAHTRAYPSESSTMSDPMPFTPTEVNAFDRAFGPAMSSPMPVPMPDPRPMIERNVFIGRPPVWGDDDHTINVLRDREPSPVGQSAAPARIDPMVRRPWRHPSPGLFLHHDPPPSMPRHSAFREDGRPGLAELPLPPLRATPEGDVDFLTWKMAYHWGLYSPEVEFPHERGRDFWRMVGEDRDLPIPDAAQHHPERVPCPTPALQHVTEFVPSILPVYAKPDHGSVPVVQATAASEDHYVVVDDARAGIDEPVARDAADIQYRTLSDDDDEYHNVESDDRYGSYLAPDPKNSPLITQALHSPAGSATSERQYPSTPGLTPDSSTSQATEPIESVT